MVYRFRHFPNITGAPVRMVLRNAPANLFRNLKTTITNHNKSELGKSQQSDDHINFNCRNPNACHMDAKCNDQNIIYQSEITTPTTKETYIGLCDTHFKLRYRNHMCSFKNKRCKHATELSKHIWALKNNKIDYNSGGK